MLLLSLGFTQGSKAKCFCLATQITLGIGACAFPLLKAVGVCTPHSAGDGIEMSRAVCLASAAEWRSQEAGVWAIASKITLLHKCTL